MRKIFRSQAHAQCVEKRVVRDTRRKEIFEINHGSRQQVYRLPHDSSPRIQRAGGYACELLCIYSFPELLNTSRASTKERNAPIGECNQFFFFGFGTTKTNRDYSVTVLRNLDFDVSHIFVPLKGFRSKWTVFSRERPKLIHVARKRQYDQYDYSSM